MISKNLSISSYFTILMQMTLSNDEKYLYHVIHDDDFKKNIVSDVNVLDTSSNSYLNHNLKNMHHS